MAGEPPGHTLQPTGLVHEAYLRLLGQTDPSWQNRAHFFAAAAEAMRRILVERARRYQSQKRGSGARQTTLDENLLVEEPSPRLMLDLDGALRRLEAQDQDMAKVAKLRYFAGLTVKETASALEVSPRTVNRMWTAARAWLRSELEHGEPAA